jgi:hypothetical protein
MTSDAFFVFSDRSLTFLKVLLSSELIVGPVKICLAIGGWR